MLSSETYVNNQLTVRDSYVAAHARLSCSSYDMNKMNLISTACSVVTVNR